MHDLLAAIGLSGRWPAVLSDLARSAAPDAAPDDPTDPPALPAPVAGRVIRADRGRATVLTATGALRTAWPPTTPPPVTGDWVLVAADPPPGEPDGPHDLLATAPRASAITRPVSDGERRAGVPDQVLAANVDLVGVVAPIDGELNVRRLERGIVMAYESGATPLVLLTKADVADSRAIALARAQRTAAGAEVLATSPVTGEGIGELRDLVAPDRTLVLLGTSGAGKSTLANALVGEDVMATGAVRAADGRGRHTTTTRELLPLPTGGAIIDTPGLRALGLGVVEEGMAQAFPDVEALVGGCRFGDCRHDGEPGCAVLAALDDGTLAHDRLEGWRRIRAASESAALRADIAAYRRQTRSWGRLHREASARARARDR